MSTPRTTEWMQRNKLKSIIVYCHEMVYERIREAAKATGCSKGNWVHNVVIERLRKYPHR
jgi:hypothetical protein